MVFKRLTSPSAGDSTHFGGTDVNKFSDYLGGTDIGGSETIDINTATKFRNGKLRMGNPANTFQYTISPAAITADRTVTLPLLDGDDTFVTAGQARGASIYTIYISGTTVKARNNVTGVIDYTADNTVDAVTAINSAITNIKNITNAGIDTTFGATIRLSAGVYKCVTTLLDSGSTNREGIILIGEGMGTILNFIPGSALTNAITFTSSNSGIRDVLIKLNANVTNGINITGLDYTNEAAGARGKIESVRIHGTNSGGTYIATTNQVGIKIDGSANKPYWWRISQCDFVALDYGIKGVGTESTSSFTTNCSFLYCITGIEQAGSEHFMSNLYFQGGTGTTLGTYGIRLTATAQINMISNIIGEFNQSITCATVLLDSGATYNSISNIFNPFADNTTKFTVLDNSGTFNNSIQYLDRADGGYKAVNNRVKYGTTGTGQFDMMATGSNNAVLQDLVPSHATGAVDGNLHSANRIYNGSDITTNSEFVETAAYGTQGYFIGPVKLGTGVLRALTLHSNYTTRMQIDATGIGFFGVTPVAKQAANADTSGATLPNLEIEVNQIKQLLRNYGLMA